MPKYNDNMKRRTEFLDILLRGSGPSTELLIAFFFGLLIIGILSNLAYDLILGLDEWLWNTIKAILASAVLIGVAYWFYYQHSNRATQIDIEVDESRLAPPHKGLIWLFGPGTFNHLLFSLKYHFQNGGATHCWLVMQNTEKVKRNQNQLLEELLKENITTKLHPVYIKELDVEATFTAVRNIFEREAEEEGLVSKDLIADITGGTKPMTTGMFLAALTTARSVEYVESKRDNQGEPIPGTLGVVLLDTSFYLLK